MERKEATLEALRKLREWQKSGKFNADRLKQLQMVLEDRIAKCYAKSA